MSGYFNISEIPGVAELDKAYQKMVQDYRRAKKRIVDNHLISNAEFKKGDFIYNVLGVIKIEEVSNNFNMNYCTTHIVYKGYAYRRDKGKLIRTKQKDMKKIPAYNSSNIRKLNINDWEIQD